MLVLALAVFASLLWWITRVPPARDPVSPAPAAATSVPAPILPAPPDPTDHPVIHAAARLLAPDGSCAEDIEILAVVLGDYRRALGGNPIGENEEITAALSGTNAKALRFLPPRHPVISPAGRLHDRWGQPFFFHAMSSRRIQITSAGPDQTIGTADDITGGGE